MNKKFKIVIIAMFIVIAAIAITAIASAVTLKNAPIENLSNPIKTKISTSATVSVYGQLWAGTSSDYVNRNSYTNKDFGYTAASGFDKVQLATPANNHAWSITDNRPYSDCSNLNPDGWYYFRSLLSSNGNISLESEICLDTVKPQAQVQLNGSSVSSGSITASSSASISVMGSDERSGIASYWYKTGSSSSYSQCYSSSTFTGDAVYTFYVQDRAGNVSDTVTITKDTAPPTVTMFNGSTTLSSGAYTNASSIAFTASDSVSGVDGLYVKTPGASSYVKYSSSASFTTAGTYNIYAKDIAGNTSSTYTLYVDRTAPSASIYAETTLISSGTHINASSVKFTTNDSTATCHYKKDTGSFIACSNSTLFDAEGTYTFYAKDIAGNSSAEVTVTLDRTAPNATLYVDDKPYSPNSATVNASSFYLYTTDTNGYVTYVKKPGASSFIMVTNGTKFTEEGTYTLYAQDPANNRSQEKTITLDRTAPNIKAYAGSAELSSGTYTNNSSVKFTTSDTTATLYVKYGSGAYTAYPNNTTFDSESVYSAYAQDAASNKSDIITITVDRTAPTGTLYVDGKVYLGESNYVKANTISYTAADTNSVTVYVKKPEETSFSVTANSATFAAEGAYTFYTVDSSNNKSAERTIVVDRTAPVVSVFDASGNLLSNSSYVKTNYITMNAADNLSPIQNYYVKLPGAVAYAEYTSGTKLYDEGTYSFYAVDAATISSSVFTVTIDNTKPTGTITSGGKTITSGSYTNTSFKYSATDNASGLAKLEIKRPGEDWTSYEAGSEVSGSEGTYYFRAYDKVNNLSDEVVVFYDITSPTVKIFAENDEKADEAVTNAGYIEFEAGDANLKACYIKLPGSSDFVSAINGAQYAAEGTYAFYAVDVSNNTSGIFTITIDKTPPTGTIVSGGKELSSGSYTNQSFSYSPASDSSGIYRIEIKRPDGNWESYTAGAEVIGADGAYYFRCYDGSNNVSAESYVYLDTTRPTGQIYANDEPIASGSYTNALRVKFTGKDNYGFTCYVKLPGINDFVTTSSGAVYSDEGRYEWYTEDDAGNRSEVYVMIVDRSEKALTLNNVSNGTTTGKVTITWSDILGAAPVVKVTVNGKEYTKGSQIKTINGGSYDVKSYDAAGNVWTSVFTASRNDIATVTYSKYWWEAKDSSGKTYSFESYNNALAFAVAREESYVTSKYWNNDTWDTGYMMDSVDSVNAKQGFYYLYKKYDDPNTLIAYFTLERLNEVIKQYAESGLTKYYYWEKNPAESYLGNTLTKSGDTIVAKSITLNNNANYLIDGISFTGTTYSVPGMHTLIVYDDYGNSYECKIIIVNSAPTLYYRFANGDYYLADDTQAYYLKNRLTLKITDELDSDAMAIVYDSSGQMLYYLNTGEELILTDAGKYTVRIINRSGVTKDYVFYISYTEPTVTATENETAKRLDVKFTASGERDISVTDIRVYYSADRTEWLQLSADDYGYDITTGRLSYGFVMTGYYRFEIEDTCRTGIDAIIYECYYDKPAPEGKLNGVNEHGYANCNVSFTWTDEASATITINGQKNEYKSDTVISEEGSYMIKFYDRNGYSEEFSFIIDKAAPAAELTKEIVNGYVASEVSVIYDDDCYAVLYFNGEITDSILADGKYRIEVYDLADNLTVIEFTLDTSPPTVTLSGVTNGGSTKGSVSIKNTSENVTIEVYLDGKCIDYKMGNALTEVGNYKVILTDDAGLMTEYIFEIAYSLNGGSIVLIVILVIAVVGGVILFFVIRRNAKFKKKSDAR